jgi:hypothetical protein
MVTFSLPAPCGQTWDGLLRQPVFLLSAALLTVDVAVFGGAAMGLTLRSAEAKRILARDSYPFFRWNRTE